MKILLYAPALQGHPQVYCRVIGDILLEAGHEVIIACPAEKSDWSSHWPVLRPLSEEERVHGVDIRKTTGSPSGTLTAEQLLQIQKESGAEATLFVDADSFAAQFRRIAAGEAPRLRGRNCAIFGRTSDWCPGEDAYTGKRDPLIGPSVRATVGRVRRALFEGKKSSRYFFEQVLMDSQIVDALIVKDERIIQRHGPPVYWMPEIYRVFNEGPEEKRAQDWEKFAEPIRHYIERSRPENILLYFGSAAGYKGYDSFLRLAQEDESAFALHAGIPQQGALDPKYREDPAPLREELIRQGRLFETNAFVESADLVSLLFHSVSRFVSTHRLTLSSGTVLQALEAGKSVLTPDAGLVGWRTREFKLGGSYAYDDGIDLAAQWSVFKTGVLDADPQAIQSFMNRFSREQTARFFTDILTGKLG